MVQARSLEIETCNYCCYPCLEETEVQRVYCGLAMKDLFVGTEEELGNYVWTIPDWCPLPITKRVLVK